MFNQLKSLKVSNKINYEGVFKHTKIKKHNSSNIDINIFIPVKNREKHLNACLTYFEEAIKNQNKYNIDIYVLENDDNPKHYNVTQKYSNINYIFIPTSISNSRNFIAKSLLFNSGMKIANPAKWNIFHDVDIAVPRDFFTKISTYLDKNPKWLQPFSDKKVVMIKENLSNQILKDPKSYSNISNLHASKPSEFFYTGPGAPGGSIIVRKDVFENIGGYDPELFHGYAPEDAFFWLKLEAYANMINPINNILNSSLFIHRGGAIYANNPKMDIYHIYHEQTYQSPDFPKMAQYLNIFGKLPAQEKKDFLNICKNIFLNTNAPEIKIKDPLKILEINLYDDAFRHLVNDKGNYSVVHDKTQNEFKYVSRIKDFPNGITIITEDKMFENIEINSKYKIGWLIETRGVAPQRYEKFESIIDKFDFVMTHDEQLLAKYPDKTKFVPFGGCWIKEQNFGIPPKSYKTSMIYSSKRMFEGHLLRHEIVKQIPNLNLFGSGSNNPIKNKEAGLRDFMFSIIVENFKTKNYFTEKLLDCFAQGTIPIYWGCPNISDYFDINGIITFNTIDELREIMKNINTNLYQSKLESVKKNLELMKDYEINEKWIYKNILKDLL